ncbi:unnamed protein product, partial [Ectocarpus sp. 13 AM-2016]
VWVISSPSAGRVLAGALGCSVCTWSDNKTAKQEQNQSVGLRSDYSSIVPHSPGRRRRPTSHFTSQRTHHGKLRFAMTTEGGNSKCLDALVVALNQACDGQEKRWYVSTLELQLVSLEVCGACRSVQTLHVRVKRQTPPSLWFPSQSHTTTNNRSPEVGIPSRVPVVQAFGLTWALPMEVLQQRSAIEVRSGSGCRRANAHSSAASLGSVVWPPRLKRLVFESDMTVNTASWPASLQQLSFGCGFNQPIVGVAWPASLQKLSFGYSFNQPIFGAVWPVSLRQLSFGYCFNQPIVGVAWPASLQQLSFGVDFNQPIAEVVWP